MPYQIFLMLIEPGKKGDPEDLNFLIQMIENPTWCNSRHIKAVLSLSKQMVQSFSKKYFERIPDAQNKEFRNTVRLLEQFIAPHDLKKLYLDFLKLSQNISDYFEFQKQQEDHHFERKSIIKDLEDVYNTFPSTNKPLRDLMSELPIQVFFHVSAADGKIHSRERARFLEIVNNPDWCEGGCARLMFTGSAYYFKDLIHQYVKNKSTKDINKVKRTIQLMCSVFKQEETDVIKKDLLRLSNDIAKASGGIGGLATISKSEKIAISQLQSIFDMTL